MSADYQVYNLFIFQFKVMLHLTNRLCQLDWMYSKMKELLKFGIKKPRSTAAVLSAVAGEGGRRDQGGGRHCQLGPVNVRNLRLIRGLLTL